MARVHLLDDELINKIAAGEVVERPASVVKELVENAIDAGATHVKVILKDGGRQLIQVQDDGLGMAPEDAVLAVKRHTTSKLRGADDLFQVQTMGFRGEALASIAAVSRFTLQTQARDQRGHRVHIEDGKQSDGPWQGSPGTTMSVADLFYNVPARRAFLKTAAAEFAACHEYMQALALSLPTVGFTLLHNDREVFAVSPALKRDEQLRGEATLRARAAALIGAEDAERLIYTQRPDRHAHVEALISPPGLDKSTARHCFTFVNGRWVRDKLLRFALQRGYHSHLMKGKFPIALLYVSVDPTLVDVNVHPAKAELRFQYAQEVQNALVTAIREALRGASWASANPPIKTVDSPPEDFDLLLPQQPEQENVTRTVMRFDAEPARFAKAAPAKNPAIPETTPAAAQAMTSPGMQNPAPEAPRPQALHEDAKPERVAGTERALKSEPAPLPPPIERAGASARPAESTKPAEKAEAVNLRQAPAAPRPLAARASEHSLDAWRDKSPQQAVGPVLKAGVGRESSSVRPATLAVDAAKSQRNQAPSPEHQAIPWGELQFVGPFARCFLLFEHQQQLLAVDQHAFHERVLYERLVANPDILRRSQPLLMPEVLNFSPTECERLVQMQDALDALGIRIQGVSETEIEVTAVPSLLVNKDLSSLLAAILGGRDKASELAHDVLATMACHAAVRAGEEIPEAELKSLLREAESVDFYHNCPHGRRVFRWWKLAQVAAWFDR